MKQTKIMVDIEEYFIYQHQSHSMKKIKDLVQRKT